MNNSYHYIICRLKGLKRCNIANPSQKFSIRFKNDKIKSVKRLAGAICNDTLFIKNNKPILIMHLLILIENLE